jgi:hypothetical protein
VVPDLPFFLSIAALSASLAGLAGLVAGLRRGEGLRAMDLYRLREIVEFSFANALLAIALVPLTNIFGEVMTPIRLVAVAALLYLVLDAAVLFRRLRMAGLAISAWVIVASVIDIAIVITALATIATAAIGALQVLLMLLLARPMTAFIFVLVSFDTSDRPPPAGPV